MKESIKMAFSAIKSNKLRTLLTMLGIIIGIASVITLVTLGNGSKQMMTKEFENFGSNRAYVYVSGGDEDSEDVYDMTPYKMTSGDLEMIKRIYGDQLSGVSYSSNFSGAFVHGRKTYTVNFLGVSEAYMAIENMTLVSGRFLNQDDISSEKQVVVIDQKMVKNFYKNTSPIGKMITLDVGGQSQTFRVVGTYSKAKSMMSRQGGNSFSVYTPYSLASSINEETTYETLEVNIKEGNDVKATLGNIVSVLERKHDAKGKGFYKIMTAEAQMKMVHKLTSSITMFVSAIAGISLLVGGIGIMNIMLVSVTERTREIGIRKAIGAKKIDILSQFMIESIIVSGVGGMIGIALGMSLAQVGSKLIKIPLATDFKIIMIAFGFSALIGVFFGIYPANKAAKLNTIDALRYE